MYHQSFKSCKQICHLFREENTYKGQCHLFGVQAAVKVVCGRNHGQSYEA